MSKGKSSLQWWADELIALRDKNLPEAEFEKGKKELFEEYKIKHKEEERKLYERGEIHFCHTFESNFEEYYEKYYGEALKPQTL
jgi:hypothetical protein